MPPDSAAVNDEEDFSIPGQDDDAPQGAMPGMAPAVQATPPPQPPQGPASWPQVSGKAKFLGNLLKTLISGVQNAPGNPANAFDRGYMGASPQNKQLQQAKVDTAQSEADLAKMQVSITGMKALQYEYLLKRLPQDDQEKHLKVISEFKQNLIKEGASVEAEADDEKASDEQAVHLNGTDSRATSHSGRFYSLPSMDEQGKPKFDVVYVPTKDVLQNDFKYNDPDGNEQTIAAGTPMAGAMGKVVENLQKVGQDQTKAQHKMLGDALKPNVPDGEIPQTVKWLENQKSQNTPLYQQNKNAVDAQINTLNAAHGMIQKDKLDQARAMANVKQEVKDAGAKEGAQTALNYADSYIKGGQYTGPGDEALMEKFFELAKPSTGFRMSQPQIDMLRNARSWMNAAEATGKHIEGGTWFSNQQRQEIAGTMKQLAAAKGLKTGSGGPQPIYASAPGKPRMVSNDGGKTWQTVQ